VVCEKPGRLTEKVPIQRVAQIHHDALTDIGDQIRRPVRSDAFEECQADYRPRHKCQIGPVREDFVDRRANQRGDAGRANRIQNHRHESPDQTTPVRS
jgi:hypothetical protein